MQNYEKKRIVRPGKTWLRS